MMKMILSIGSKPFPAVHSRRGLTFLELMVTIVILSTGIVAVYKGLLASLDYQGQLSSRLYAMNLMDHEIAMLEKQYETTGEFPMSENGKVVEVSLDYRNIPFQFTLQAGSLTPLDGLVRTDISLHWPDRGRDMTIKRSIYLVNLKVKPADDAPAQQ